MCFGVRTCVCEGGGSVCECRSGKLVPIGSHQETRFYPAGINSSRLSRRLGRKLGRVCGSLIIIIRVLIETKL